MDLFSYTYILPVTLQLHALSDFFLFFFLMLVASSEVQAGLLFSASKRQKLAQLPRGMLKLFETEIYLLNRKFAIGPP